VTAYPGTTSNMSSTLLHRPVISSGTFDIANDLAAMITLIDGCSYLLGTIIPCRTHPASVNPKIAMILDHLEQQTSSQQLLSSCSSIRFRPPKERTLKQCRNTRVQSDTIVPYGSGAWSLRVYARSRKSNVQSSDDLVLELEPGTCSFLPSSLFISMLIGHCRIGICAV
jgi:hypothetical protein